jgi:hypothetical protein
VPADPLASLREAERLANAGQMAAAEGLCRTVLATAPAMPEAQALMGILAARQKRFDEALALLDAAIAQRDDVPQWHHERRHVHRRGFRLDAALADGRDAVRLDPANPKYWNGLGQVHTDRGEAGAAIGAFMAALARDPQDTEGHLALAHALLAGGDYPAGFREYEWRFRTALYRDALPTITRPTWNGMRMPGQTLLLGADQGYGDSFHFARYIPLAAERCGAVVVLCRPPQVPVLRRLAGVARCITDIRQAGPHAAFAWMASLPFIFGTDLGSIPATTPYLTPDPARRAHWRAELARRLPTGGIRVGLVWAGNPDNGADWRRSLPLAALRWIADIPGLSLVSLQRPLPPADQAEAAAMGLPDLGPALADFGETAAVLANLDLLVSVDTAVAHLAGAMGLPAWVLIHQPADWRWLTGRSDSPWYPSLRLFRQPRAGDWDTPLAALRQALAELG